MTTRPDQEQVSNRQDTAKGQPSAAPPSGADHASRAECILGILLENGAVGWTPEQQLAAAAVHAHLAIAARLGEVADAVRSSGDVAGEIEALRCGGIAGIDVSGAGTW